MAAREPFNVTERAPTAAVGQHSPWHSPVPYLFGGLAAMLGLIAFALLILACSYWKLSGYLESGNESGDRDLEAGEGANKAGEGVKQPVAFEEKMLVIMAGQVKPTYLATPMSSRSSSFGDNSNGTKSCSCSEKNDKLENGNGSGVEMVKQGSTGNDHQVQSGNMENTHESSSDEAH